MFFFERFKKWLTIYIYILFINKVSKLVNNTTKYLCSQPLKKVVLFKHQIILNVLSCDDEKCTQTFT